MDVSALEASVTVVSATQEVPLARSLPSLSSHSSGQRAVTCGETSRAGAVEKQRLGWGQVPPVAA